MGEGNYCSQDLRTEKSMTSIVMVPIGLQVLLQSPEGSFGSKYIWGIMTFIELCIKNICMKTNRKLMELSFFEF